MLPYLIAGAIGYAVAKIFEEDEAPKYAHGGSVLLAPNGKPSNLTPEQYKLVRTPAFKAWFGDWQNDPANASKVVDFNGEPLVVFHGTKDKFTTFDKSKINSNYKQSIGFHFSDYEYGVEKSYASPNSVNSLQGFVLKVFLNIKNPLISNSDKIYYDSAEENIDRNRLKLKDEVIKNLKDGIISYGIEYTKSYVVFESNQIKLANGTNTTFDGSNPDIRYVNGGELQRKYQSLIEGYELALEIETDKEKINMYQNLIEGYKLALQVNADTENTEIEEMIEEHDKNKDAEYEIDCIGVQEIEIKNFDEKEATEIMNKYLNQYRIRVVQWSKSSCGFAFYKKDKDGYWRIKVPKPTNADRFGVVMHEIYHCIDSFFTKPSYLQEFRCDKFALDRLQEMNLDTSIWEKRIRWHILSRVAMATNRGHKNVAKEVKDFFPDIDFESWYGKKVFVGNNAPKGIGAKNPKYWDYIYIEIE
jgi:hypothetical protein